MRTVLKAVTKEEVIEYMKEHKSLMASYARSELGWGNITDVVTRINNLGELKIASKLRGKITFDWHKQDVTDTEFVLED